MAIRLEIKFSIPTSVLKDEFKKQLHDVGFYVEEILPCMPSGHEVMAYKMTGMFNGDWQDVFAAWKRVSIHAAIEEALLRETQK